MAFQNIENDNEPVSLAEDGQEEIMEEGQIDSNVQVLEPEAPLVEPEDEDHFEETTYMEVTKEPERTIEPEKIKKSKRKKPEKVESRSISKLHSELRKHSVARKKTDLAIRDIEKQLKGLLLSHHSAIKDLQKQVTLIQRKVATFGPKKSAPGKKVKKKKVTKKLKKKISKGKNKKR